MVVASQAIKIAPAGIHPQAFSFAKKCAHGLSIHPSQMNTAAQTDTVSTPTREDKKLRKEKRFR